MSNALFLPRELFQPAAEAAPVPAAPSSLPGRTRAAVHFSSGEAVAADLLRGIAPVADWATPSRERRRRPRSPLAGSVDLYIDDLAA